MKLNAASLIVGVCLIFLDICQAGAVERKPLLLAGKTSLFQRILTRPGAHLCAAPGCTAMSKIKLLPPLS